MGFFLSTAMNSLTPPGGNEIVSPIPYHRDVGSGARGMSAGSLGRAQTAPDGKTFFP